MADAFDVVVLGGGSGGYVAAIRLAQYGKTVALVEADKLGGTCLHRGCIPTKAFLASAGLYDQMRRAGEWGLTAAEVSFDFAAIAARKDRIVGANEQGVRALLRQNGVEVVAGRGTIVGPGEIAVAVGGDREPGTRARAGQGEERRLTASDLLIATGSRPKSLPGLAIDGDRVVSSDHVTQWTELPRSIAIAGAGAVGAEFASALRDFGLDVTLIEFLPRVLPLEDADVSAQVARSFDRRGIDVLTGARLLPETLKRARTRMTVEVDVAGTRQTVTAERLLVAIGREPSAEGVGLERTRATTTERGFVEVDRFMRTADPHVYACGDVVGGLMLAHVAYAEGKVAAASIAGKATAGVDYDAMPRATYTRPEVASMGLTAEQATAAGHAVKVGTFTFRANARASIAGEPDGLVKVVSDGTTGEVLGVHMAGPHVTELIAEPVVAKLLESTPFEIGLAVHAHPTLSEAIGEAAADVDGLAIHRHAAPARA